MVKAVLAIAMHKPADNVVRVGAEAKDGIDGGHAKFFARRGLCFVRTKGVASQQRC
jgi:hypothetical protein